MTKRKSVSYPPGTFIPTPQRVMAIMQLCLAFSLLLWNTTQPFMGEYFALRSRMLIYEFVMGSSGTMKTHPDQEAKLERNKIRFAQLPESEKAMIKTDYQQLQDYVGRTTGEKIESGLRHFVQEVPPFEQAWIFFSIIISILILLKKEGAKQAVWLLPLIAGAFAVDNLMTGRPQGKDPDESLFPTEAAVIEAYVDGPFGSTPQQQREQLEKGWKQYLIDHWSPKSSQSDSMQLEEAEVNFTVARLNLLHSQPRSEWLPSAHEKMGWPSLLLYLLWNLCFAWMTSRPIYATVNLKNRTPTK